MSMDSLISRLEESDGSERNAAIGVARVNRSFHDASSALFSLVGDIEYLSRVAAKSKDAKLAAEASALTRKINAVRKELDALEGEFTEAFAGSKTQSLAQRGMDKISPDDV